ncbi:MAG: signal recognition particle-docking protein FtsY [Burkholderiaceae bacterium]
MPRADLPRAEPPARAETPAPARAPSAAVPVARADAQAPAALASATLPRPAATPPAAPPSVPGRPIPPGDAKNATAAAERGPATPTRSGWFNRLRQGLSKSRGNQTHLFTGARVDEALFEDIETALIAGDAGVTTTEHLIRHLRERARRDRITDAAGLKQVLREALVEMLTPLEQPVDLDRSRPLVMMIAGVNGAGKTTSIGKLARHLRAIDQTVLLAAGDTFRAAAREQLTRWGERNEVQVIASDGGDPAAVAFDAVKAGIARRSDVVIVDTAGRLPTQTHLMDELKKIRRVIAKAHDGAPHEVLLVLDGNTGQNMLAQVKAFDDAVQVTGLVVTKLDGTAKGGAIAALAHTRRERPIPVYFIGVGEGVSDLEAFSAREFASALVD